VPARDDDLPDVNMAYPASEEPAVDRPTPEHPAPVVTDRASIVARQRERFGGIKVGSAFFGWLTATGMAVLLIALLAAGGVEFGVATNTNVDQATQDGRFNGIRQGIAVWLWGW
jgi:hypothetical protein